MNLKARVAKLEEKHSTHTQHNWLFTTIIGKDSDVIGAVIDINPNHDLSIQNKDKLPNDEFLALATKEFGIDMAAVYYDVDNEILEMV